MQRVPRRHAIRHSHVDWCAVGTADAWGCGERMRQKHMFDAFSRPLGHQLALRGARSDGAAERAGWWAEGGKELLGGGAVGRSNFGADQAFPSVVGLGAPRSLVCARVLAPSRSSRRCPSEHLGRRGATQIKGSRFAGLSPGVARTRPQWVSAFVSFFVVETCDADAGADL